MAGTLTEEELARCRDAFASFDPTGGGTIPAGDVCKVMERLGKTLSGDDDRLLMHPDVVESQVRFDEFLTYIVGPPVWETNRPDPVKDLCEAVAAYDDGGGYVALRDLIHLVREQIGKSRFYFTEDDLLGVCREALDGSWSATAGDGSATESMWKVLEEEFPGFRREQWTERKDSRPRSYGVGFRRVLSHCRRLIRFLRRRSGIPMKAGVGNDRREPACVATKDGAGGDGGTAGQTAQMINLTVVDVGGNQVMCDAVASTWSVQALQQHIEGVAGVPVHRQFLFLVGDDGCKQGVSPDDACLTKAGMVDGSTLVLAVQEEAKLDYKSFLSRVVEVESEQVLVQLRNSFRRA